MKEQHEKKEYIAYKLKRADDTLKAAYLMIDNEMWESSINRLYYAAFYAVSGLLLTIDLKPKSHAGIRKLFFENFLKNKKLEADYGILYAKLFDWRNKGDYGDFVEIEKETAMSVLEPCKQFIERIKEEIEKAENQ